MRFILYMRVLASLLASLAIASPALGGDAEAKQSVVERAARKTADDVEKTAKRTGRWAERTADRAVKWGERTGRRAGNAVGRAAEKTDAWLRGKPD